MALTAENVEKLPKKRKSRAKPKKATGPVYVNPYRFSGFNALLASSALQTMLAATFQRLS